MACQTSWVRTHRAHYETRLLADRHYNRQKVGSPQFVPPGRCLVLLHNTGRAFWVTSWPFSEYVRHAWPGAWVCSAFRSEGAGKASNLIQEAIIETVDFFGEPPVQGMVTFINRKKVNPIICRGAPTWGRTFAKAGFKYSGETKGGLMAMVWKP
jgi:hypothetical protein